MTNKYNEDVIYVPDCMARSEELMFPLKNASPELTTLRNIAVAEGLIDRTLISMAALLTRHGSDPAALTLAEDGERGLIEVEVSQCMVSNTGAATGWSTPAAALSGLVLSWNTVADRYRSPRWAEGVAAPTDGVLSDLAQLCDFSRRLGERCDVQTRAAVDGLAEATQEYRALSIGTAAPANGWRVHRLPNRTVLVPYLPEVFA